MAERTSLARGAAVIAPDGIAVYPVPLPDRALLSLAVGRIPAGQFGVHLHGGLEQVTYVLAGRLIVRIAAPDGTGAREVEVAAGAAVVTPPAHTLSFGNAGPEEAEVLFICVPPYPADHADTATPGAHRALAAAELRWSIERLRQASAALQAVFAERTRQLEELLARVERLAPRPPGA